LHSIKEISIGDFYKLYIAFSPGSFVSSEGKVWISLLAIFTNNFGIVVLVVY
jgi:hypothetical protein